MKYYDLVFDSCKTTPAFEKKLGFDKIFILNKPCRDFPMSSNKAELMKSVKDGTPAMVVSDFSIDRKLMAKVADSETVLCIPFGAILSKTGFERSRLLYKAASLVKYAHSKRIEVSFASLAESNLFMNSAIQLIGLAKLTGATDLQARQSLSVTNKKLGEAYDKNQA